MFQVRLIWKDRIDATINKAREWLFHNFIPDLWVQNKTQDNEVEAK